MSGHGTAGAAVRAAYLVYGAREADEPDADTAAFRQFEKDWDAQLQRCASLAAERGYQPVGSAVLSVAQPTRPRLLEWADDPGCEVVIVPSERILGRLRLGWPDWDRAVARLAAAGARVEAVPGPEPAYPGERHPD